MLHQNSHIIMTATSHTDEMRNINGNVASTLCQSLLRSRSLYGHTALFASRLDESPLAAPPPPHQAPPPPQQRPVLLRRSNPIPVPQHVPAEVYAAAYYPPAPICTSRYLRADERSVDEIGVEITDSDTCSVTASDAFNLPYIPTLQFSPSCSPPEPPAYAPLQRRFEGLIVTPSVVTFVPLSLFKKGQERHRRRRVTFLSNQEPRMSAVDNNTPPPRHLPPLTKVMPSIKTSTDDEHRDSLFHMVSRGELRNVKLLFRNQGNTVNDIDDLGSNALFYASSYGQSKTLQFLINSGINVNHLNNLGQSALMVACAEQDEDIVEILIANGAIINIIDKTGTTPLMYAANTDNFHIVKALLKAGGDVLKANYNGLSAMNIAVTCNYRAIQSIMEVHLGGIF